MASREGLARSRLQLAFELVQEAPIGAVRDDLLRARLDEAGFVQAQGIESDRVLGVVLPPFVVRQPAESLQRIIVSLCKAAIDEQSRSARRLGRAQIGRLENGPRHPFGRHRILLYEFTTARQHAAKVLRPGAVDGAVDDHMADPAGVQFLRLGRCLVAATSDIARALANSITPLIIVLLDPEPGLAQTIAQK